MHNAILIGFLIIKRKEKEKDNPFSSKGVVHKIGEILIICGELYFSN